MDLPESLPARLYLLAYDTRKERLTARSQLGYVLRAAALTELLLGGHLADDAGKARAVTRGHVRDPVLDAVLQQIAASRPRSWKHWVSRDGRRTRHAVQDQLEAGWWIRVEPRRVLGIFPVSMVTLRQPHAAKELARKVAQALRSEVPPAGVDPRDAALVALAVAGELCIVIDRRQRREHKRRIAELTRRTGPTVPALRKVVQDMHAAAAAG